MQYWYYSDKRNTIGQLASEEMAVKWADAHIPGIMIFAVESNDWRHIWN